MEEGVEPMGGKVSKLGPLEIPGLCCEAVERSGKYLGEYLRLTLDDEPAASVIHGRSHIDDLAPQPLVSHLLRHLLQLYHLGDALDDAGGAVVDLLEFGVGLRHLQVVHVLLVLAVLLHGRPALIDLEVARGWTHGAERPPGVRHVRLQPQRSLAPLDGLVQPLRLEALHLDPGLLVTACTSHPPN